MHEWGHKRVGHDLATKQQKNTDVLYSTSLNLILLILVFENGG